MILTAAQLQALKTDILANAATLQAAIDTRNGPVIAAFYNSNANPSFTVWKTNVTIATVGDAINGTELGNLTTANTSRLQVIQGFFMQRGLNPSKADVRQMFDDIFSTGGVTKAALLILWKRFANRVEKLFATGTGSDASPATLVIEGSLGGQDVLNALDS